MSEDTIFNTLFDFELPNGATAGDTTFRGKKLRDYTDDQIFKIAKVNRKLQPIMHQLYGGNLSFDEFSQKAGFATVPDGYDLHNPLLSTENAGAIYRNINDNSLIYLDKGRSSNDLKVIEQYIAADKRGLDAQSVQSGELAQEIIGEVPTRIASTFQGVPFLRELVNPAIAAGASAISQMDDNKGAGYSEILQLLDRATDRRAEEAPLTSGLSRLATAAGTAGAFAPLDTITGNTRLGRYGKAAGIGGALGLLEGGFSGFIEGATNPEKSALTEAQRQGVEGGVAGTVFGPIGESAGDVVGSVAQRYSNMDINQILNQIGFDGDAARVVRDFLAMDAAQAPVNVQRAGPYGSIASFGPNTQMLLDAVANDTGRGATLVRENLEKTAETASLDLKSTLDAELGLPSGSLAGQKSNIMANTRDQRSSLYKDAYDFELDPANELASQIIQDFNQAVPSSILARARESAKLNRSDLEYIGGVRVSEEKFNDLLSDPNFLKDKSVQSVDGGYMVMQKPTVESVDAATRALLDAAESAKKNREFGFASDLRVRAMEMRKMMDEINPAYAEARLAGKDAIDQRLAAELGDDILSPRVEVDMLAREMESLDDVARKQLLQGLRNRIDKIQATAKNVRGDNDQEVVEALALLRVISSRDVSEKFRVVLGDEAASRLATQIANTQSALLQKAAIATNSKTFVRQQVSDRINQISGVPLGETVARQGVVPTVAGGLIDTFLGSTNSGLRGEEIRARIGETLSQNLSPEMLADRARILQNLNPAIRQAAERGQSFSEATKNALLFGGMSSVQDPQLISPAQSLGSLAGMTPEMLTLLRPR